VLEYREGGASKRSKSLGDEEKSKKRISGDREKDNSLLMGQDRLFGEKLMA